MSLRGFILLLVVLGFGGGCAKYEYDLLEPKALARHIGAVGDEVARVEPLEYRLRTVDNFLVLRIHNPTGEAVSLLGDLSYAITPEGQSHPLSSQTIAAGTFIKVILPPPRPYYRESGPSFGIGFGVGVSRYHGRGHHRRFHDDSYLFGGYDEPRYYTKYDPADATYWDWSGEGTVRVRLTYQTGGGRISHDFAFGRKKM